MPWLMKAEPDSRIVKGKDVKFSVDDFEKIGVSPWDGVRSHEAKKIMKEKMKLGDKVLFYHSNTKEPGVYALAEVVKEGYPDSWDPEHPYFDPKSNKDEPTWYMVSVKFVSRLPHPPSLALIKYLASSTEMPEEVDYIGAKGYKAVKEMQLVNRGRLSVQPVTEEAYEAVVALGNQGGWEGLVIKPKKAKAAPKVKTEEVDDNLKKDEEVNDEADNTGKAKKAAVKRKKDATLSKKRGSIKAEGVKEESTEGTRRSKRVKIER